MRVSFTRASSVVAVVCVASVGRADDLAAARKLFAEGLELEKQGDWPRALEKFRAVAAVRANHIVHFHIALCLENTGKLVDALAEFSHAKVSAEQHGGTDAELTITNSKKHIDALRARIPAVSIKRPVVPGALVTIDGSAALFDVATPLDPGVHAIEVRAEGYESFAHKVTLTDGVREPVAIEPELKARKSNLPPPRLRPVAPEAPPPSRDRTFVYVAAGVSAASLAAAGVFYGLRAAALSELDGACDGARDNCDPGKRALDDRGRTYTVGGNIALAVGAVALGAAVTLLVLEPKRAAVVASAGSVGLRVTF